MQRRLLASGVLVVVLVLLGFTGGWPTVRPYAQEPSSAKPLDLVPVNVYVADKSGKPITDLKQSDFTIIEDGSPQPIRHFSVRSLVPGSATADSPLTVRTALTLAPQDGRIFVIMLGRGRLEDATKAVSSLIAFVRKLLPQDRVALFAHNRAFDFTTDHEKVALALERCRKAHTDVDVDLDAQLGATGMVALYGRKAVPKKLQAKIDDMIAGPGAKAPAPSASDVFEPPAFRTMTLDDFMFGSAQAMQDQANLRGLLEYLRRYDGEKHLLFVTEKGVDKAALMPSESNDAQVAQVANDGRVAIHPLHVGGIASAEYGKELESTHQQTLALQSLRRLAEMTGGGFATMERGGAQLDRLDQLTRNGYVLGYQPTNSSWDGAYRNIVVKVNRPDATVYYRHGYFRTPAVGGFDRRAGVVGDRLVAAAMFRRQVDDIKVKARASQSQGGMTVEGKIDVSKLVLAAAAGRHTGTIDVGVFCIDSSGAGVGSHQSTIEVSLSDDDFARAQKDGMAYSLHFPMLRGTDNIRFVVYDYRADLIGRADTRVF